MATRHLIKLVFTAAIAILLTSCVSSSMLTNGRLELSHRNLIDANFKTLGTASVSKFIDYRPMSERMLGSDDAEIVQPANISSLDTNPPLDEFLLDTIKQEITRTGIFALDSTNPQYQVSGIIYSMAVGSTSEKRENPLFDAQGKMEADQVVQEQYYFARIKLLAVLKQGNKVIFRHTYSVRDTKPIQPHLIPDEQARMLDMALTKIVAQMFLDMEQAVLSPKPVMQAPAPKPKPVHHINKKAPVKKKKRSHSA